MRVHQGYSSSVQRYKHLSDLPAMYGGDSCWCGVWGFNPGPWSPGSLLLSHTGLGVMCSLFIIAKGSGYLILLTEINLNKRIYELSILNPCLER